MQKTFNIKLDLEKEFQNPVVSVSQNDLNSVHFTIEINQDGRPFDLTGLVPRIAVRKPSGLTVFADCDIIDGKLGLCEIILPVQAHIEAGTHQSEIHIYNNQDPENLQVGVTGTFRYSVKENIMNDLTVESTTDWQTINVLLDRINESIHIVENLENVDVDLTNIQNQIDTFNTELEAMDTDLIEITNTLTKLAEELEDLTVILETTAGFTDGNSIEYKEGKRIHLKTDERWIRSEGHLSDLIKLQWLPRTDGAGAKPALVWVDENGDDKTAIISHDLANDPTRVPHKHLSVETTMSPTGANPGELFTRMEFPYDEDRCQIQTHSSDMTVNGGTLKVANENGTNKEFHFCRSNRKEDNFNPTTGKPLYDKVYSSRWSLRADSSSETGGNNGSDFRIVRYSDDAVALDSPFFIKRSSGNIGIGTNDPQRKLDINDDRIRIRNSKTPNSSTDVGKKGDVCYDNDYMYVCVADNTWKRTPLQTW